MSKCPGLHCPGCRDGGSLAAIGIAAAAVLAAAVIWDTVATLLLPILVTVTAAAIIAVAAAVTLARRTARPVYHSRPAPAIQAAAGPSRHELEDRLQRAEISAQAALLAVSVLTQQPRPLPLSGPYSDTERVIRLDR